GIDWDWLREQNADVVAWLTVEGTSIDMPVMAPSEEHPGDWYLSHGLEGGWSYVGCAYVDDRTTADSAHALVYGHHITGSHLAFTEIYDAHEQEAFDGIGAMRWHTPARGETVLAPCMAMVVDQDDAGIQRFAFHGDAGLRSWLATLSDRASARAPDCAARCAMATRVVTLVTCASDEGGQRERTLLIFVA
ncbi:MAG: class B sortase, partial [Olsenella sp.]|nr:class B sortase [Olsenella sp.]